MWLSSLQSPVFGILLWNTCQCIIYSVRIFGFHINPWIDRLRSEMKTLCEYSQILIQMNDLSSISDWFLQSSYYHYQFVINVFLLWIIAFHNILNLPLDKGAHDWLPNTLLLSTIRYSIVYSVNKQELLISMRKCISSFDGYSH